MNNNFFKLFFLFLFFSACMVGGKPGFDQPSMGAGPGGLYDRDPPPIERRTTKRPDPIKQAECSKKNQSNPCENSESCKDICDDIFSARADKKDCYRLPEGMVEDFETLIEHAEDGDVEDIDPEILECLLDIDDREFARAVKKMNRSEARDFLIAIADDDHLAEVLDDEDDEHNILKQILYRAVGSSGSSWFNSLTKEIDDGKSFFWLSAEGSEDAWDYFDDYVTSYCENGRPDECTSKENIQAYCNALDTDQSWINDNDLEDFLAEADHFAEEYEGDVESDGYSYEVDNSPDSRYTGDFKDWCKKKIDDAPVAKNPCPDDGTEPDRDNLLAEITFATRGSYVSYIIDGGFCYGEAHTTFIGEIGSGRQDIILLLSNEVQRGNGELYLNKEEIGSDFGESGRKFYLYIDDDRFDLGNDADEDYSHPGTCTNSGGQDPDYADDNVLRWRNNSDLNIGNKIRSGRDYNVYLASEKNGVCKYYQ